MPQNPPPVGLNAPGICHNADITGDPHAGQVTRRPGDGLPQVEIDLGTLVNDRHATLKVSNPEYLISLVDAVLCGYSNLTIAYQDADRPGRVA